MQNVADSDATRGKRPRHQKATMAVGRFTFSTHQADATLRHIVLQTIETGLKRGRSRHRFIIGDALTVETCVARPAAQGFTIDEIRNTGAL
jgi:hypothetical protein